MVRTVSRWLLVGVCVWLLFGPAQAAMAVPTAPVDSIVLAQQAPSGPDIPAAQTTADADNAKNRLVVGVVAVALLGIVYLGRRIRKKSHKKDDGGS